MSAANKNSSERKSQSDNNFRVIVDGLASSNNKLTFLRSR